MGKGGYSSFGEDSILEKVEANVLRKPFKIDELRNLIKEREAKQPWKRMQMKEKKKPYLQKKEKKKEESSQKAKKNKKRMKQNEE